MDSGKLRIGDDWNAITIIALSQNNPLKAVAEFVENSIDAKARHITITRGREQGEHYLQIKDDGEGVRRNESGVPDFRYVATHICDSIKRRLKAQGQGGIQGEFGIGLLSFWTIGEELRLSCPGADGKMYQMRMRKGDPDYRVAGRRQLVPEPGTELLIRPLLPGVRQLSGEKIQWYLASELRDRIRQSGVEIRVVDRAARAEYRVEPRQFDGRLLHELCRFSSPDSLYLELYLNRPDPAHQVGLYRCGTRVLPAITELEMLQRFPWNSGYLQGVVGADFLRLTPGSRTGLVHDDQFARFLDLLAPVEAELARIIEEQKKAEEEETSRDLLRSIQKALREAMMVLPAEEYDWFLVRDREGKNRQDPSRPWVLNEREPGAEEAGAQRQFFEFPGPLFSVRITPGSSVIPIQGRRNFRAVARDRKNQQVGEGLVYAWRIVEGEGALESEDREIVTFVAPEEPCLVRLEVTVRQGDLVCTGEALVTVTDTLLPQAPSGGGAEKNGLPGYTFQKAPGELWRSRMDLEKNVIVINNGHRDFVYASRNKALKLRYISRLFSKELVLKNFTGIPSDQVLERLIELSLYTEEHLK